MRFVNPKNDVAFKKIFGSEDKTHILISFLNAVLGLTDDKEIQQVTLLNPYQTPKLETLKMTILDIQATDKRGITYIIEMQLEQMAGAKKRFTYYTAKAYSSQIERGEEYPKLNQVIFIGILDFVLFEREKNNDYLSRHQILNVKTHQQELEDLDIIPQHVDDPALQTAYETAEQFGWTKADLEAYEYRGIKIQDQRGALELAEWRGERRKATETARQMKADGLEIDLIVRYTGLSSTDIAAL